MPSSLFVGLNTVDLQFLVSRFPRPNSKTKATENTIAAGGPATNAAIACAHLGGQATLLTPIGKHALASFIVDDIQRCNVDIIDPIEDQESAPVFASIITTQTNGDRTVFSYHPERSPDAPNDMLLNIAKYRVALFDGFYPQLAAPIAEACRAQGVMTVLDGGSWKPDTEMMLKHIDIAILSNDFRLPQDTATNDLFSYLHTAGVKSVAITRGEQSILFSHEEKQGEIDIPSVTAIDTLGAGDIFHGAYCYYFAEGFSFETSLEKASKIAAKSCLTVGTRRWMRTTDAA